jgi:hypothetical protein
VAQLENGKPVSLWKNLWQPPLVMTDTLAKLLIDKGVITDAEFKQKLLEERAVYQRILNPTTQ